MWNRWRHLRYQENNWSFDNFPSYSSNGQFGRNRCLSSRQYCEMVFLNEIYFQSWNPGKLVLSDVCLLPIRARIDFLRRPQSLTCRHITTSSWIDLLQMYLSKTNRILTHILKPAWMSEKNYNINGRLLFLDEIQLNSPSQCSIHSWIYLLIERNISRETRPSIPISKVNFNPQLLFVFLSWRKSWYLRGVTNSMKLANERRSQEENWMVSTVLSWFSKSPLRVFWFL
jgi:hypothetical protein